MARGSHLMGHGILHLACTVRATSRYPSTVSPHLIHFSRFHDTNPTQNQGSSVAFIGNTPPRNESGAPFTHTVSIDGGPVVNSTFPLPDPSDSKVSQGYKQWYTSPTLSNNTPYNNHNVTIADTHNVAIDFAIVTINDLDTPISRDQKVLVDDRDPAVHYTGDWKNMTDSQFLDYYPLPGGFPIMNSTHQSQVAGDCLEFRFTGQLPQASSLSFAHLRFAWRVRNVNRRLWHMVPTKPRRNQDLCPSHSGRHGSTTGPHRRTSERTIPEPSALHRLRPSPNRPHFHVGSRWHPSSLDLRLHRLQPEFRPNARYARPISGLPRVFEGGTGRRKFDSSGSNCGNSTGVVRSRVVDNNWGLEMEQEASEASECCVDCIRGERHSPIASSLDTADAFAGRFRIHIRASADVRVHERPQESGRQRR